MTHPDARNARVPDQMPLKGESIENTMNLLLCDRQIAGYALVQPTGQVLVAFGCLFDGLMNAPDSAVDMVNALLVDTARTVVSLKGKKLHVVRREPDMLVAVEGSRELEQEVRYPVACSAHSIVGNNVLLVAYERGGHRRGVPTVVCALHDAA